MDLGLNLHLGIYALFDKGSTFHDSSTEFKKKNKYKNKKIKRRGDTHFCDL